MWKMLLIRALSDEEIPQAFVLCVKPNVSIRVDTGLGPNQTCAFEVWREFRPIHDKNLVDTGPGPPHTPPGGFEK